MTLPIVSPLLQLPTDIVNEIGSRMDTSALNALARTAATAHSAINPMLTFIRMKAGKERGVLPEVSVQLNQHLHTLALEIRLRRQIREEPAWKQDKAIGAVLRAEIAELPPLTALYVFADHFEALMGDWKESSACLDSVLTRAAGPSLGGKYAWQVAIDGHAALLRSFYATVVVRDKQSKISYLENVVTKQIEKSVKTFLLNWKNSAVMVEQQKLTELLGELLRAYTRGAMRNWPAKMTEKAFREFFLEHQLVSGPAEWENIFKLATSSAHSEQSYLDLQRQNQPLASETSITSATSTTSGTSGTSATSGKQGKHSSSEPQLSARTSSSEHSNTRAAERRLLIARREKRRMQGELVDYKQQWKTDKGPQSAGAKRDAAKRNAGSKGSTTNPQVTRLPVKSASSKKQTSRKESDSDSAES